MTKDEEILPLKLQKSLNKIIGDEHFKKHTIETRIIPPDGGSFMAIRRAISIKGKTENDDKELNLYVKTMIPEAELTIYSVPGVYETETSIYLDIFKAFNEIQNETKVPFENRFFSARPYEGVDSESIIMEDLSKKGYAMCKRLEVLPLKFAEAAIRQLAKFHSISFVLESKRPAFFEAKLKSLKQPYRYNTPDWDNFVGNVSRMALTILEPEARKKAEAYLPTTFEKYYKYTTEPNSVRTLVHNDFRANNVMVKLVNNEITDAIILDFQQTFYGCPIVDFLYFIFSGTDQEFRRQHLQHLKNLYHNTVTEFLAYFNLDAEEVYSRKEFERLYKERLDYGLMISLWLVPVILADEGEIPDVTKVDLNEVNFNINDTVKGRVRGIVDDFIKWGYL